MSMRSLVEINFDYYAAIKEHPEEFVAALIEYIDLPPGDGSMRMDRFGMRSFGLRHHTESYHIKWGGNERKGP